VYWHQDCKSLHFLSPYRKIITPVMERSATIASITTRELVLKDFAMEPDEQNMRKAAHAMVQSLAGISSRASRLSVSDSQFR